MNNNKELTNQRFEEIRNRLRTAPPPDGDGVPDWLKNGVEDLYEFFNATADLWDQKFGNSPGEPDPFYQAVAQHIPPTEAEIRILDLGCGTGLELSEIFPRAPRARVTAVDLAPNMLHRLITKFDRQKDQIALIQGNYLDVDLGEAIFDYAVSTLTLHHLPPENKVKVYRKIRTALKDPGWYIEGDQSCLPQHEVHHWYHEYIAKLPGGDRAQWNYDVTLSVETNRQLLCQAGFSEVNLAWEERDEQGFGLAVLVAR